jgi:hypothetical protein
LLYVGAAYPWTTADHASAVQSLRQLIREEEQALAALGQFLTRRRVALPVLGAFPSRFTTINFLALDYVLPRLIQEQQHAITELQRDLAGLVDNEARQQIQHLLDLKRRHQISLEGLLEQQPQPTAS